jgi:hypothetical protein
MLLLLLLLLMRLLLLLLLLLTVTRTAKFTVGWTRARATSLLLHTRSTSHPSLLQSHLVMLVPSAAVE